MDLPTHRLLEQFNPANFPFYTTTNSSTVCSSQPNTCNYKCFLVQNTEIGNHALPNLFLPSHPHQSGIRCKISSLILASGPRPVSLALGQPRAEGPGLPAFTTVVKPRPSGQCMAILSEAARPGPPPSSDPEEPPPPTCPPGPPQAPPLLPRGRDGKQALWGAQGHTGLQPIFTSWW